MIRVRDALDTFEAMLRDAAMGPDTLRPWDTWKVFKALARLPCFDAALEASFQYILDDSWVRLYFVCEYFDFHRVSGREEAVCCLICDFGFKPFPVSQREQAIRSRDCSSLDAFFTAVEGDQDFQAFMNRTPTESAVYDDEDGDIGDDE